MSGKSPEAVFYSVTGEEVERLDISGMTRAELNQLMEVKGIHRRPVEAETEEKLGHDEV